jgi:hypothetical protein
MSNPENSYTGVAWFGVGPPLVIGVGIFLVGVLFMIFWRLTNRTFWLEQPSVVDPALAAGHEPADRTEDGA